MWNPYDFSGKRFIVTGAGSGIGKATAVRLSEQGAEVCLLVLNNEQGEEVMPCLSGKGHRFYVKDLANSAGGGIKTYLTTLSATAEKSTAWCTAPA